MARARVVDDWGKGRETLRHASVTIPLVSSATVQAMIARLPASARVQRVSYTGDAALASLTSIDVIAVADTAAISTAPSATNRLIAQATSATAIPTTGTIQHAVADQVPANSVIAVAVVAGATAAGAVSVEVEYDMIGTSYSAYDEGTGGDVPTYS